MSCSECPERASCCVRCCDCRAGGYDQAVAELAAKDDESAIARVAALIRASNDNPDLSSGGSVAAFLEGLAERMKKGHANG